VVRGGVNIAGVDPGLYGAVAFLAAPSGAVLDIADMPTLALPRGGRARPISLWELAR
jgi:hypothetical protein